jgi:hypothetical protein
MTSSTDIAVHVVYALQLSLGIIFAAAAAPKLRSPTAFAAIVAGYGIAPRRLAPAIAAGVTAIETFLAFAFLSGALMAVAVPLAAVTLAAFTGAVAVNLRRDRRVPCGCFGDAAERISLRSLGRLAALLGALAILIVVSSVTGAATVTLESVVAAGAAGLEYLVAICGVSGFLIVVGMWLLNLPELTSVLRRPARRRLDDREVIA